MTTLSISALPIQPCSMRPKDSLTTRRRLGSLSRAFVALVAGVQAMTTCAEAAYANFKNQCSYPIEVFDNHTTCPLDGGSKTAPSFGCGRIIEKSIMYRHGENDQATLAEFSSDTEKAWYDISIIPPGPGNCSSLEECHTVTGKVGFNVPIMILPTKYWPNNDYPRCERILCHYDGCPDAFHFPADTQKVHNCPNDEEFEVIFCP